MKLQKQLVRIAMLTALTVAVSLMFLFPVPGTNGFVTLAEAGIYSAAYLLGPIGGFWVGALSGGLIDLFSGYPQWILASVIIHGAQGFITGYFFQKKSRVLHGLGLVLGSLLMVAGYGLATGLMYTWPAGVASIFGNVVQNIFGVALTVLLMASIRKINLPIMKEGHR
ncbi:ECF transporter S component [Enterococcus sp. LJL98]